MSRGVPLPEDRGAAVTRGGPLRVAVVGMGALGSVFAAVYEEAGLRVLGLERDPNRLRQLRDPSLGVWFPDGTLRPYPEVTGYPLGEPGAFDLIHVSVKGYDTPRAAEDLAPLVGKASVILSVQNGLGSLEALAARWGGDRVLGGVTAHSAETLSDGTVRYRGGRGPLLAVGPFGTPRPPVLPVIQTLNAVLGGRGYQVEPVDDVESVRWKKLIANVATNPVAALTGRTGREMLASPSLCRLIDLLAEEAAAVARAKGLRFPELIDPGGFSRWALEGVGDNRISMLQDVQARRPTEIGNLNEALVVEAEQLGLDCPAHRALTLLVRALEEARLPDPPRRPPARTDT